MKDKFNENDPWHANAHLMFGFQCISCSAEIDADSFEALNLNKDFLEYCVHVSDIAKQHGWTFVEAFNFRCPKCSQNIKNTQPCNSPLSC